MIESKQQILDQQDYSLLMYCQQGFADMFFSAHDKTIDSPEFFWDLSPEFAVIFPSQVDAEKTATRLIKEYLEQLILERKSPEALVLPCKPEDILAFVKLRGTLDVEEVPGNPTQLRISQSKPLKLSYGTLMARRITFADQPITVWPIPELFQPPT
jgi:hypothetical protein